MDAFRFSLDNFVPATTAAATIATCAVTAMSTARVVEVGIGFIAVRRWFTECGIDSVLIQYVALLMALRRATHG